MRFDINATEQLNWTLYKYKKWNVGTYFDKSLKSIYPADTVLRVPVVTMSKTTIFWYVFILTSQPFSLLPFKN